MSASDKSNSNNPHDAYEEAMEYSAPVEGDFDVQLTLPLPPSHLPEPFTTIIKRDGRQEPFDKNKIAEAIFKAAHTIGGQDRNLAMSLASAVSIYLTKRLGGSAPTVDQVHDAVERVLIYMDHVKTALAYVRFRDQRARIRKLREGDIQALMNELEEARLGDKDGRIHALDSAVRTSNDTLTIWERAKIVEALVRETALERPIAELIALEVEQQLQHAKIKTLTTSLVRELVDARLIAHGLEEHCKRHRRLGVPLYDLECILRGTHEKVRGASPDLTDHVLAGALKKEYALVHVYAPHVVDAHLEGMMHLHDLEYIDRLDAGLFSMEPLLLHGMRLPGISSIPADFTAPPANAMEWLAQWSKANAAMRGFFINESGWKAFNVVGAPLLKGWSVTEIEGFARSLVYECALQALHAQTYRSQPVRIGLHWYPASTIRNRNIARPDNTTETYADHQHAAQQLAWAILEIFRQGGSSGIAFPAPHLEIILDDNLIKSDGHEVFLHHAASVATLRGNITFRFVRNNIIRIEDQNISEHNSVYSRITLNMPRVAYDAGSEARLFEILDERISLIANALQEKRNFIEGLLSPEGHGCLRSLGHGFPEIPWVNIEKSFGLVALEGLWECVVTVLGKQSKDIQACMALGERILKYMDTTCRNHSERLGINIALSCNEDRIVGRRLTALDLRKYPHSVASLFGDQTQSEMPDGTALAYSPGISMRNAADVDTFQRVSLEGTWHPYLDWNPQCVVPLPMNETSEQSVVDFLLKVFYTTTCRAVCFR